MKSCYINMLNIIFIILILFKSNKSMYYSYLDNVLPIEINLKIINNVIDNIIKENIDLSDISYIVRVIDLSFKNILSLSKVNSYFNSVAKFYVKYYLNKLLISHAININDNQNNLLIRAIKHGYVNAVILLVNNGANVNSRCSSLNIPALVWSIHKCHEDIAELLINLGADVNIKDDDGYTPLICASKNGLEKIVKLLLSMGADVNIQSYSSYNSLLFASIKNHVNIAELLINAGININAQCGYYNRTALIEAIVGSTSSNNMNMIKFLVLNNADINIKDKYGNTALIEAVKTGFYNIVKFLIDKHAEINVSNRYGTTPLIQAINMSRDDLVKLLLDSDT